MFKETHPTIGARDIKRAMDFYTRSSALVADPDRNALTFYRNR